jgi:hypothetical protein
MNDCARDIEDVPVPKIKSDPKKWKKNMLKQKRLSGGPFVNAAGRAKPGRRTGEDCKYVLYLLIQTTQNLICLHRGRMCGV